MLLMKDACAFYVSWLGVSSTHTKESKDERGIRKPSDTREAGSGENFLSTKYIWSLYLQRARANGRLPKK